MQKKRRRKLDLLDQFSITPTDAELERIRNARTEIELDNVIRSIIWNSLN